jgi:hypothetical protein
MSRLRLAKAGRRSTPSHLASKDRSGDGLVRQALDGGRDAAAIKAPYLPEQWNGRLLVDAATRVAEASKEGGFLGIGGTRVSAQEQEAIDEIALLSDGSRQRPRGAAALVGPAGCWFSQQAAGFHSRLLDVRWLPGGRSARSGHEAELLSST